MTRQTRLLGLSLALALVPVGSVRAQSDYVLDGTSSRVSFHGRALTRRISGISTQLLGRVVVSPDDPRVVRGYVRFAVASLDIKPQVSDEEVERLFGGTASPDVTFEVDSTGFDDEQQRWYLYGRLTMRGVSRDVRFDGTAFRDGERLVAHGFTSVDMRDWGIRPPSRVLGLVRMDETLTLSFRAEFQPDLHAGRAISRRGGSR
jgi:polyisoprenoid-binding protein YceI